MEGGEPEAIRQKIEGLNQAMHPIAERIYSQAQQSEGGDGAAGDAEPGATESADSGSDAGADAEDVDYEVVDDDDKS
jgi:molecular chaperone DnaK